MLHGVGERMTLGAKGRATVGVRDHVTVGARGFQVQKKDTKRVYALKILDKNFVKNQAQVRRAKEGQGVVKEEEQEGESAGWRRERRC
eukprot:1756335-Rhodomonas_salina.1